MKKLFIIAVVAALGAVSCTKDRTCTCTDSDSKSSVTTTTSRTIVKSTKSQAKANCVSIKYDSNGTTYTTDCKLN